MIAPLRTWHRRIIALLAILLPIIVALALTAREPALPENELPTQMLDDATGGGPRQ